MKVADVAKLSALDRLLYFVRERDKVRLLKESGKPRPWTDDEILQSYRFCNIRRMDDKVSRWLLENWYKPYFDHPNMLEAVLLARFINRPSTLEKVGFPIKFNPRMIKDRVRRLKESGVAVYTHAYMVRGNDGEDKIEAIVDHYIAAARQVAICTHSQEETHSRLCTAFGMGSFMAGQIVADLRWAISGAWEDRNDWAAIGPGSKRGMNRLHRREIGFNLSQDQFLDELKVLIKVCYQTFGRRFCNRLEAIDYQNICCEMDKYSRLLFSEGRVKSKYDGFGSSNTNLG